ncbi:hypothetical protein [Mucilaginibacter jinjuensis]|uniref:Uncharacterized protein n=1 Tax=Mucilaginibacter jinjuensis TaxID=1176721 RepID=A0ABY7T3K9_9SPHI|nr:hypothetical protein [Mucilaginibacter jinjuensis]WCT10863.1 hypothetical protein PQO05_19180 [Mucilaginibacter jinjuensis]
MKKLLLFCLLLSPALVKAQTTEPAKTMTAAEAREVYCTLTASDRTLSSTKVNVTVNYGQVAKDDPRNIAEAAKVQAYITIPDALNYMATQGWTVVSSTITSERTVNTAHFLLKRIVSVDTK